MKHIVGKTVKRPKKAGKIIALDKAAGADETLYTKIIMDSAGAKIEASNHKFHTEQVLKGSGHPTKGVLQQDVLSQTKQVWETSTEYMTTDMDKTGVPKSKDALFQTLEDAEICIMQQLGMTERLYTSSITAGCLNLTNQPTQKLAMVPKNTLFEYLECGSKTGLKLHGWLTQALTMFDYYEQGHMGVLAPKAPLPDLKNYFIGDVTQIVECHMHYLPMSHKTHRQSLVWNLTSYFMNSIGNLPHHTVARCLAPLMQLMNVSEWGNTSLEPHMVAEDLWEMVMVSVSHVDHASYMEVPQDVGGLVVHSKYKEWRRWASTTDKLSVFNEPEVSSWSPSMGKQLAQETVEIIDLVRSDAFPHMWVAPSNNMPSML